ncbi:response regulator transcription factor [Oligella urethralis]|uniref:Chemotaxis protein CheY n=1 Tax=Oligella urethralis DNF00040 TaxID=1401065 RepID=A0A095Z806_9BURK|nr:response regulator transcription factor [Oligella urethralis]KGF30835.1 chemotaxis protein CheY [Oligella urethralis DNF00040]
MMTATESLRVLIVEDHSALAQNLAEYFDEAAYQLDFAADGLTALHLLATNQYDVIVLDIMLPAVSGLELCQRIRDDLDSSTPIIMMTAKDQIEDKTLAFSLGADDYLVKPFALKELELRIHALARRHAGRLDKKKLRVGQIVYDPRSFLLTVAEVGSLHLSGIGARIFETLMKSYPNHVSYQELQQQVWGEREVDMNTIRTQTYALRKLLSDTFGRPLIKTIYGVGYELSIDAPEAEE